MIHINNGENGHEWISKEECERRFPDLLKSLMKREVNPLRKQRVKRGITTRQLAKACGLLLYEVSAIERDPDPPQEKVDLYIMGLGKCTT